MDFGFAQDLAVEFGMEISLLPADPRAHVFSISATRDLRQHLLKARFDLPPTDFVVVVFGTGYFASH